MVSSVVGLGPGIAAFSAPDTLVVWNSLDCVFEEVVKRYSFLSNYSKHNIRDVSLPEFGYSPAFMYNFMIAFSRLKAYISFLNAYIPSRYIPPKTVLTAAAAAVTIDKHHVS